MAFEIRDKKKGKPSANRKELWEGDRKLGELHGFSKKDLERILQALEKEATGESRS